MHHTNLDSIKHNIEEALQNVDKDYRQIIVYEMIYRWIEEVEDITDKALLLEFVANLSMQQGMPYQFRQISISNKEEVADFLQQFLKADSFNADNDLDEASDQEASETSFSENDFNMLRVRFRSLIKGLVDMHSNQGYSKTQYYQVIWASMEALLNKADSYEKGYCLYEFLSDTRTPYFELKPGMMMPNDQYISLSDELSEEIAKLRYVLSLKNIQKTQTASQLLQVFDELQSKELDCFNEKQCVLMSHVIALLEER